jgi:hypothetical protein
MTATKVVVIDIGPDGSCSIDLLNFKGAGCSRVAKEFVGNDKVKLDRKKREYLQTQTQAATVKAQA